MLYLVTIAQHGQVTRIKLGNKNNVLRAIDWAIKNQHGVCVKEFTRLNQYPEEYEEYRRANILWAKIDSEII